MLKGHFDKKHVFGVFDIFLWHFSYDGKQRKLRLKLHF